MAVVRSECSGTVIFIFKVNYSCKDGIKMAEQYILLTYPPKDFFERGGKDTGIQKRRTEL